MLLFELFAQVFVLVAYMSCKFQIFCRFKRNFKQMFNGRLVLVSILSNQTSFFFGEQRDQIRLIMQRAKQNKQRRRVCE
jgi:hypothetical protein